MASARRPRRRGSRRDYATVLLTNATATSSPAYCKDAVVFNSQQCGGFTTDTARFAAAG
ncbi:hypothetical protein ACFYP0_11865 [Micromonospora arida]|uniref:hypothetical protein n=1 Tax=Micromonospora arida TaxID=2203715 RepID=UPI0033F9F9E6